MEHNNDSKIDIIKIFYESRRFETDLYWKRSQYFWTLIGVIFTAYTVITGIISKPDSTLQAIVNNRNNELLIIRYLLVCIALVFSVGWWLVNRGSKYTSEKWSLIIEKLNKSEPLLKDLSNIRPDPGKIKFIKLLREYPISSSRVNHIINLFIIAIWLLIFILSSISIFKLTLNCYEKLLSLFFLILTIITTITLFLLTKRSKESYFRL